MANFRPSAAACGLGPTFTAATKTIGPDAVATGNHRIAVKDGIETLQCLWEGSFGFVWLDVPKVELNEAGQFVRNL